MARKYPMTVEEIVTSYRQAKNQQTQIGVLADLNVCTRKEIKELLTEAGALQQPPESKAGRPVAFDTEEARRLWDQGLPDAEIAARLEIPTVRFAKWRQRVGLLRPRTPQKNRTETEQEEQSVKKESVEKSEASAVTVKGLRVLLDAAEAAGYGEAPLVLGGRHLTGLHLRVETLIGAETPGTLVELQATAAEA